MRKLVGAAACGLLLLIAAGCGGSGDASTETSPGAVAPATTSSTSAATTAAPTPAVDEEADQAIVDAALLKLNDFPTGWTGHPDDEDDDDDSDAWTCPGLQDLHGKTTAKGSSPDFENDGNEQVSESIAVFPDETLPHQFVSALGNQEFLDCMEDKMLDEIKSNASDKDVTLGDVKLSQLRVNDRGDESAAIRVAIPMEIQGIHLDAAVDIMAVRVGRSVLMMTTLGVMSPMSDADRERFTAMAADKLATAMN